MLSHQRMHRAGPTANFTLGLWDRKLSRNTNDILFSVHLHVAAQISTTIKRFSRYAANNQSYNQRCYENNPFHGASMEWTIRYIKRESSILSEPSGSGRVKFVTWVNLIKKIFLFIAIIFVKVVKYYCAII